GLGFGYKWNMGWMNDTLSYMENDPVYRKYHHNKMTFSIWYAYSENFILPLSHDEVVHGKGSLINKMPGDDWKKFAGFRLLLGYMYAHPGKKLTFMGLEIGQRAEWNHDKSLDWHLLDYLEHQKLQSWVKALNHFYQNHPELFELDFRQEGFSWIDCNDADNSTLSFLRFDKNKKPLLVAANFTPVVRTNHKLGVPESKSWTEVLNSDHHDFGGSNTLNRSEIRSVHESLHGFPYSISINIPPLGIVFLEAD
ncbi:MAG: alpha amylase C-terminal domain-containing protein, partial [Desulfonatronovibrio sp.]